MTHRKSDRYRRGETRCAIRRTHDEPVWKPIAFFLRDDLSKEELKESVHSQILCTAAEYGDFVRRIGSGVRRSDGWRKWNVSYLPGPPGVFRD